ncbi:MAG: hypothetical protein Q9173_002514 [Seirophora scorigena]
MAATHTVARRKPTAYGKASRKALYHESNSCAFSPSPPGSSKSTPTSGTAFSKSNLSESLTLPYDSPRVFQQTKPLQKAKQSSAGLPQPSDRHYHRSPRRRAGSVDDWDISSSDIDQIDAESEFPRVRKKRKYSAPQPAAVAVEHPLEQTLLTTSNQSLSLITPSNHPDSQSEPLHRRLSSNLDSADDSSQVTIGTDGGERAGSNVISGLGTARAYKLCDAEVQYRSRKYRSPPSVLRQSTKAADLAYSIEANELHSPSTRSRRVAVRTPRKNDRAHCLLPSNPCISATTRRPVEGNTPHQRELWGMLLQQANQGRSIADGPSLNTVAADRSLADCNSAIARSADGFEQDSRLVSTPRRRRRIIDILQPAKRKLEEPPSLRNEHEVLSGLNSEGSTNLDRDLSPLIDNYLHLPTAKCLDSSAPRDTLSPSVGQLRLMPSNGLKVTYSNQRSHLATNNTDDATPFDVPSIGNGMSSDATFSSKRVRHEVSTPDQAALEDSRTFDTDSSQSLPMRTIHELRESGETVRQLNEMEALFDDVDGVGLTPTSLRRGKLLELAVRQQEPACCRLLVNHGFSSRLLAMSASSSEDAVTATLLASTMLHLIATPFGAQAGSFLKDTRVADLLASRLQDDQDLIYVVRDRRSNISKRGQSNLEKFFYVLLHSDIWRSGTPNKLSSRVIGLQGLDYLVRKRREADYKADILPPETIRRVVNVLPSLLSTPALRSNADSLFETRLTVSILESCTISGAKHDDSQWTGNTLAPVLAILPWLNKMSFTEIDQAQRSVLRLYLNLTNNNVQICHEFAKVDVIRSILGVISSNGRILSCPEQGISSSAACDTLILALGTLINLVEWSSTVRNILITKTNKDGCSLEILVGLFTARLKVVSEVCSEEGTTSNVAFGYLSILLAYLSVDEEAREVVADRLDGRSLQPLLVSVQEFLQYHRQIGDDLLKDEEADLRTSFIGRLESVIDRL